MEFADLVGMELGGGKWRLVELIGFGGQGAVFRAKHRALDRPVAIKISLDAHRSDRKQRFLKEAQIMSRLDHPGIVKVLDCDEHPDPPLFYMVQEFVQGRSFKDLLAESGALPAGRVVALISPVLDALAAAHRADIVHRDIKPANLMLTTATDGTERVRVLDFGIAKVLAAEVVEAAGITQGSPIGTPEYMAPEQWAAGPISAATDVYAVGVMLYQMLTGRLPFHAAVSFGYYHEHLNTPVAPLPGSVPGGFDAIVQRALAKRPADRYGSALAMREALHAALGARNAVPPGAAGDAVARSGGPIGAGPIVAQPVAAGTVPVGTGTASFEQTRAGSGSPGGVAPTESWTHGPSLGGVDEGDGVVAWSGPPVQGRAAGRRWSLGVVAGGVLAIVVLAGGGAGVVQWMSGEGGGAEGGVPPLPPGAGRDAGQEAGQEAEPDAGRDVARDAGRDAGQDAGQDAARDVARDAARPPARPDATTTAGGGRGRRRRTSMPPPPTPAEVARDAFDRALAACQCSQASARLAELRGLDASAAATRADRYEEECQILLPDNCRSQAAGR